MKFQLQVVALLAAASLAACTQGTKPSATVDKATTPVTAPAPASAAPVVVYVDDLDLTKAVSTADEPWNKAVKNTTPDENPIKLGGKSYPHSFGINSIGTVVINVKGAAKSFSVTVGIDDDSGQGSCRFFVIGDGKVLAKTDIISSGQKPQVLTADLTGVQQLVLKCDDGDDTIDYDHADWIDAKITLDPAKASQKPETVAASQEKH